MPIIVVNNSSVNFFIIAENGLAQIGVNYVVEPAGLAQ
jgi:hypothetical protein